MRVLHVIYADPAMYPPTINACRLQAAHGFEVSVAGLRRRPFSGFQFGPGIAEYSLNDGQTSSTRGMFGKLWEWYRFRQWIRQIVRQTRPDALVGYDVHGFEAARRAAGPAPVVFHLHDLPPMDRERPVGRLYRRVASSAARNVNAAAALVVPEKSRLDLVKQRWQVRCPSFVVANCAMSETSSTAGDALRHRIGVGPAVRMIVRAGGGGDGHLELETIDALKLLPDDIHLCLIGCGDSVYSSVLAQRAEAGCVSKRVHLLDFVDYDTLRTLLPGGWAGLAIYRKNSADLNKVHAATASGKMMEYIAAGLPSVVSDAPDFREFSERYGCIQLTMSERAAGIAKAIRELYEREELHGRLRAKAIAAFRSELNYPKQYGPVLSLLDTVVAKGSAEGSR